MDPKFIGKLPSSTVDIERMPETPQRGSHHRRAHSDTSFRMPNFDDLLLFDPSDLDISNLPSPLPQPDANTNVAGASYGTPMAVDSPSDESNGQNSRARQVNPPIGHLRSLSVDSDFFDGLGLGAGGGGAAGGEEKFGGKSGGGERRVGHHRHSNSMDGSTTTSFEAESSMMMMEGVKKAMAPDKLAELALIDPKRAKRFFFSSSEASSFTTSCYFTFSFFLFLNKDFFLFQKIKKKISGFNLNLCLSMCLAQLVSLLLMHSHVLSLITRFLCKWLCKCSLSLH